MTKKQTIKYKTNINIIVSDTGNHYKTNKTNSEMANILKEAELFFNFTFFDESDIGVPSPSSTDDGFSCMKKNIIDKIKEAYPKDLENKWMFDYGLNSDGDLRIYSEDIPFFMLSMMKAYDHTFEFKQSNHTGDYIFNEISGRWISLGYFL